ncbi:hypothetical protein [Nocardioides mesophilus]|uniref:RDD family protein n=1 Tax=Nocardioides mesophilus TaxID=433659 RepID=A0A7G9RFD8_9ACTN|nr:hypothetical protein [Nocardioides mesophilus]QNN54313.1 hypothetical protein H9L09_08250 [Nocardioides mesophilus]
MSDSYGAQSYPAPPPDPTGYGSGYGYAPAPIPYASWIQRVGGYVIDMLVVLPGYAIVLIGLALAPATMDPVASTTPGGSLGFGARR